MQAGSKVVPGSHIPVEIRTAQGGIPHGLCLVSSPYSTANAIYGKILRVLWQNKPVSRFSQPGSVFFFLDNFIEMLYLLWL